MKVNIWSISEEIQKNCYIYYNVVNLEFSSKQKEEIPEMKIANDPRLKTVERTKLLKLFVCLKGILPIGCNYEQVVKL